jgi:hypothetical protein
MDKIIPTVYYDYHHDGTLGPKWFVLKFEPGSLDWSEAFIHIPVQCPFNKQTIDDFNESIISITVEIGDLTVNCGKPDHYGIYLTSIKKRIELHGFDLEEFGQFVILAADIEEILQVEVFTNQI